MEKERKRSAEKLKNPPNLCKVGDSWMVDFVFRGQRYRENIGPVSKTIAKEIRDRRKSAAAEGHLKIGPKVQDILFEKACAKYLGWYEGYSRPRSYERHLTSSVALKTAFVGKRLSQISSFLVERYRLDRKKAGKAEVTINREVQMLKHLFNKAIEWGFATANPVRQVKMFREEGRTRWLTQEEAQMLLAACGPDFRVVVLPALQTGLRSSELKSFTWRCLDLRNRFLTVEGAYSKNHETKTVPLTAALVEIFREMQADRVPQPASEDSVFVSRYGKPWKSWRTAFKDAVERAGLKDFTFHTLRHTFGSHFGMANTNQKAMMELMGHKDSKMTMRYTHLSMDYKRQAVENLPKFGAESPQISPLEKVGRVVAFAK